MKNRNELEHSVIITNMTEYCRWLRRMDVTIVKVEPTKGIYDEDIIRVTYVCN